VKKQEILVGLIIVFLSLTGCAATKRGMLKEDIYYSTDSPHIQIKVDSSFSYVEGGSGEAKHQFRSDDNSKGISIHHIKHDPNQTQVDYYNHPSQWIFGNIPADQQIETGTLNILNKQWYYCNSVELVQNGCLLMRDIRRFTDDHDIFLLRYAEGLPLDYDCESWKKIQHLSPEQKKLLKRLDSNFSKFIGISDYDGAGK
jgi:hypothetical protein